MVPALIHWARNLNGILARHLQSWMHARTPTYRPEQHYMRGPGPKWREKRAHATVDLPRSRV
jgi:hypothetical protein